MLKSFHHAAIICSDYQRSRHFYVEVLGLEIIAENFREVRNSYKLDLGLPDGGQIELFSFPNALPRPSYPEAQGLRHLAFCVDQLEPFIARLTAYEIDVGPIRTDEFTSKRFTFFADPDDLPLEIYES